ncbi:methyltransferase domain-containing protein [Nonomuraea sp. NPDC049784]|uniref:protein-L-isoaspartate O-methyltransferase family protein n=1 Tax=Nonomuraea sp. NPDC049784 TaxID=3154361 RepID=UPI0033D5DEE5
MPSLLTHDRRPNTKHSRYTTLTKDHMIVTSPHGRDYLLRDLIETLIINNELSARPSDDWRSQALRAAPRDHFVPDRAWVPSRDLSGGYVIDHRIDPDDWLLAVYRDTLLVTKRGDGDIIDTSVPATSAVSRPGVVMRFLELLQPQPGDRVLEVGTASGWTAGLLAHRVGDGNLITIEIDPELSTTAKQNLSKLGLAPIVVTGDATMGSTVREEFDRIHVTCGVRNVPQGWTSQLRPGGVMVLPWMPAHGQRGEILKLQAPLISPWLIGRFCGSTSFIMMSGQDVDIPTSGRRADDESSWTSMRPTQVMEAMPRGFGIFLTAVAPDLAITKAKREEHNDRAAFVMELASLRDDSYATIVADPAYDRTCMTQSGRGLGDILFQAYRQWVRLGKPGRDRFGLWIGPDREVIWLDRPSNAIGARNR